MSAHVSRLRVCRHGFFPRVESRDYRIRSGTQITSDLLSSFSARGRPTGRVEHSPPLGFAPRFLSRFWAGGRR